MILKYAGTNDPDVHFLLHASTQNRSESFSPFILLRIAGFSPSCFPRSTNSTCTISTNPAPRKGLRKKPKYFFVKLCDLENGPPRSLPKKKKRDQLDRDRGIALVLYHLLSSHLHVGPRNGAQDWKHRAAMPSEIAVAKIKLALGRDHRDTSHQSTATHRTSVCSRGPQSRAAHRIPGAAGVRGPTKSERTEHPKPTGTETPQSPLPSRGPRSRHSSSKSQLLFANLFSFLKKKKKPKGGELSGRVTKAKVLGQLLEWVSSISSHHPRDQGELLSGQEGTLTVGG